MLNSFTLLSFAMPFLLLSSPELRAQDTVAEGDVSQRIQRLQYRYEIEDIDGIGELIEPLFLQVVGGEGSTLDVPQKHLIAVAAMKFHLATGDHNQAILPYLVARHQQTKLEQTGIAALVDSVDEPFRNKHLPPMFFSENELSRFHSQLKKAIEQDACLENENSAFYAEENLDHLSFVQKQMLDAISVAKENPLPSDREILKLIEHHVTQLEQQPTLAHESLATAIEGLKRLDRTSEAERLRKVFQTQFPYSRRLDR